MSSSKVRCLILLALIIMIIMNHCYASIIDPSRVKSISWKPRAFMYEGFLTQVECQHLISIAKPNLTRSAVSDLATGMSHLSAHRTSHGMFIPRNNDPIVGGIEEKISAWTFLPKENGEAIQVLRYEGGEGYEAHFDFFQDKFHIQAKSGNRIATVLMYLNDVIQGGETLFPLAQDYLLHNGASKTSYNYSTECAKRGLAVKPRRGDAIVFFGIHVNGSVDGRSLHEACPVIKGLKWSAVKWIRMYPIHAI
ncbi:hypothetical protein HN51_003679 [Arachis hypogaea]|uniref:procollagen-proline 4-dioxygenase n=2 Tax=Arachis TaxID=3817 RepID=A0A445DK34_ARAHY|nr:prolyl 4-hydroxylase 2 isoform X1 [Arachis hypogaea]QHO37198.1 putative prolyl 4-hydroxylase [Arachis hypogaea]RYR63539.1 hypothetical protein Ahy_A04g021347 [Arachis hypogaea]